MFLFLLFILHILYLQFTKNKKMKKPLLSICALLAIMTTFAQQANHLKNDNLTKDLTISTTPNVIPYTSRAAATPPIWYDDCSDASTWVFTNTSTLGLDWYVETDPALYPAASSAGVTPLAMTTASNGFLFISSDFNNTADFDGTFMEAEVTNATPVDLTNYPNVQLTFQSAFRWWHDTRVVRVSPDNGLTWIEVDEISNELTYSYPNQTSNNPHMSTYDISAAAGGQSQVLVQFYYNDNDYWGWFWPIDDVAISELPDNLVVSSEEVIGGWWINYQTIGGLGQDYTSYPLSQATANPYAFESVLRNGGVATQSAKMYANVTGAGNFSTTSNAITLTQGQQDTVAGTAMFTPTATGLYNIEMWAEADSAGNGTVYTYTDTATKMTMVTDYIYGKDNGTNDGGYWRLNRIAPNPGGFEVSSSYDIYADATLYSVDANIADWSIPGSKVYAVLYEEDLSGGDPIPFAQSDDYTITQADLGAWINIPFLTPQSLFSTTKQYRIAIGAYLHPTDSVGINVSSPGDYYSSDGLFDKDGLLSDPPGTVSWYTISDIPMLRMNFDPSSIVDIYDVRQTMFNVFPNPTNGIFTIELDVAGEYDVMVYNFLGQIVLSTVTNTMLTTIDLSIFDKGIYTVELKDKNTIYAEKIIVE
jgi:hypothetical protein